MLPRPGHAIALCALALLMLGVVMVNSAGMSVDPRAPVTFETILTSQSTIYMVLAVLALIIAAATPVWRLIPGMPRGSGAESGTGVPGRPALSGGGRGEGGWRLWPMWLAVLALGAVLATVYVPGLGHEVNGSHRWLRINIGTQRLSVQPSEIAKWGMIFVLAWACWRLGDGLRSFTRGLLPVLVAVGAVAGFIVIEDLGTGVLVAMVGGCMLLAGGARWWHFALMIPPAVAAFAFAVLKSPYRLERIQTFLDPYRDPQGAGYHMIQSMVAIANGGGAGRGLGHGLQKMGYLPEDQTDFLFSIINEELGIPGAALVVGLYVGILWAGYLILRAQSHPVPRLLTLGIITTVGLQAIVNIAVVTGVGPTKGIALPLLSSGGTGWILTTFCLGLLVALDRESAWAEEESRPAVLGGRGPRLDAIGRGLGGADGATGGDGVMATMSGRESWAGSGVGGPAPVDVKIMPAARAMGTLPAPDTARA